MFLGGTFGCYKYIDNCFQIPYPERELIPSQPCQSDYYKNGALFIAFSWLSHRKGIVNYQEFGLDYPAKNLNYKIRKVFPKYQPVVLNLENFQKSRLQFLEFSSQHTGYPYILKFLRLRNKLFHCGRAVFLLLECSNTGVFNKHNILL